MEGISAPAPSPNLARWFEVVSRGALVDHAANVAAESATSARRGVGEGGQPAHLSGGQNQNATGYGGAATSSSAGRLTLCRLWVAVHELVDFPAKLQLHLTSLQITYVVFGKLHVLRLHGQELKRRLADARPVDGTAQDQATNVEADTDADAQSGRVALHKQHLHNFLTPATPSYAEEVKGRDLSASGFGRFVREQGSVDLEVG